MNKNDEILLQSVFDCLPEQLAIIDSKGTIISVNQSWRDVSVDGRQDPMFPPKGSNLLSAAAESQLHEDKPISELKKGIRTVLDGRMPNFSQTYPSHSAAGNQWIKLQVSPFQRNGGRFALIRQTNISHQDALAEVADKEGPLQGNMIPWHLGPVRSEPNSLQAAYRIQGEATPSTSTFGRSNLFTVLFNSISELQLIVSVEEDGEFRVVDVNKAYLDTTYSFGIEIKRSDIVGRTITEIASDIFGLDRAVVDQVVQRYRQAAEKKQTVQVEESYETPGGTYYAVSNMDPILDENGICRYVLYSSHDITQMKTDAVTMKHKISELKKANQEIAYFRNMVENSTQGIGTAYLDRSVHYQNPAMMRLLGIPNVEQALKHEYEDFYTPEDLRFLRDTVIPTVMANGSWSGEIAIRSLDGQVVPSIQNIYLIRDDKGNPLALSNVVQDITELKRVQHELNSYRDQLQEKVKERTLQLEKEIEERKRAEQQIADSLAEKEILLREIHHRVKNNLNTVSNLLYLQSRLLSTEPAVEAFEESRNRIQTMARVHELLYGSESLAEVDMDVYFHELATDLAKAIPFATTQLSTDAAGLKLGIDQAIPCGLILTELVSNSLKYAFPSKNPDNRIDIRLSDLHRAYCLEVADNGRGLPEGLRANEVESLGLRLVRMLTRQLNGKLEVESDKNAGTRFQITFKQNARDKGA